MDKKEKIIQEYLLSKASYRLIAVGSLFELQDNYESKKHMPFRLFTGCVYICFATTVFSQTDVGSNVMTLQAATEILSKTEFNNQTDWDTYPTADYYCDKCKQAVSINFESLTKHQFF